MQLLDNSIVVGREGKQIAELSWRFGAAEPLSARAQEMLCQLIASHQANLLSALQKEDNIHAETSIPPKSAGGTPLVDEVGLAASAQQNHVLGKELTTGTVGTEQLRSAESKVTELRGSINQTRAAVQRMTADLQNTHRFYGKR